MSAFRQQIGNVFIVIGVLCVLFAAGFAVHNYIEDQNAGSESAAAVDALAQMFEESEAVVTAARENGDDVSDSLLDATNETFEIDGVSYIGLLLVPQLGLTLPVQTFLTEAALKSTPCVYGGTVAAGDLIIAGHNYNSHFTNLRTMAVGEVLYLQLADGVTYGYQLIETEIINETEVSVLEEDTGWDLTLFTCYTDNTYRVVLRFETIGVMVEGD